MSDLNKIINCTSSECLYYNTCCKLATSVYYNTTNNIDIFILSAHAEQDDIINKKPWFSKSGQLVRNILRSIRYDRNINYGIALSYLFRYRPTCIINNKITDRSPNSKELNDCSIYTINDIITLNPKVILLMGIDAAKGFGFNDNLISLRGLKQTITLQNITYTTIITYHPSDVLKNQSLSKLMRKDIELAFNLIN